MEHGLKPVWVFDGTPPDIKGQIKEQKELKKMGKVKVESVEDIVAIGKASIRRTRNPKLGIDMQNKLRCKMEVQIAELEQ
jgi:hypothetical protein